MILTEKLNQYYRQRWPIDLYQYAQLCINQYIGTNVLHIFQTESNEEIFMKKPNSVYILYIKQLLSFLQTLVIYTMALAVGNVRLHVKATGTSVQVPANPRAKLMYYVSCVCDALQLDTSDTRNIARLKDYQNYAFLSEDEKKELLVFCAILSPDVLLNKVFFHNDRMCGDSNNEFYDIGTVSNQLVVSSSIVIGGQKKSIRKIMTFKMVWLERNYLEPMQALASELEEAENSRRRRALQAQRNRSDDSCVIL